MVIFELAVVSSVRGTKDRASMAVGVGYPRLCKAVPGAFKLALVVRLSLPTYQ